MPFSRDQRPLTPFSLDIILNGEMQVGIELAKRAVEMKPRVYSTGPATSYGSVPPASKGRDDPASWAANTSASCRFPLTGCDCFETN